MKRHPNSTSQVINTLSALLTIKKLVQAIGKPTLETKLKAKSSARQTSETHPALKGNIHEKLNSSGGNWRDAGVVYVFILLFTGFPLYVGRGAAAAFLAPLAGGVGWLITGKVAGIKNRISQILVTLAWAILGGLSVGLPFYAADLTGEVRWYSLLPSTSMLGAALGFLMGLTLRLAPDLPKGNDGLVDRNWRKVVTHFGKVALIYGSLLGVVRLIDIIPTLYLFSKSSLSQQMRFAIVVSLSTVIVGAVSIWISLWLGWFGGKVLQPILARYEQVWAFFTEIASAIAGYLIAYAIVIFVFAAQYWAAWILDATRFYRLSQDGNRPLLTFWDFIYFSLQTITTAGPGDVPPPRHLLTQTLISLELLVGIILTTFFVSALFTGVKKIKDVN